MPPLGSCATGDARRPAHACRRAGVTCAQVVFSRLDIAPLRSTCKLFRIACVTSHTPNSAVSFGTCAKYNEIASRALSATGRRDPRSGRSGSRTPEGSRGTERVFEKLDVVNFSISHFRQEREGRSDLLAG